MKYKYAILYLFAFQTSFAQLEKANWIPAEILFSDDEKLETEVILTNQFFEGTLIAKKGERKITLSPYSVKAFTIFDENKSDSVLFETLETSFLKARGSKLSFLNLYESGEIFSLYKKRIADKNWVFVGSPFNGWAYAEYLQNEVVLFISDGIRAYQISKPSGKKYDRRIYKVENSPFYNSFGNKKSQVKKFVKANSLNIRKIDDILTILDFANNK